MSKNPSELAAVLRTAASACDQISMHNDMVLSMTELYNK